MKMDDEKTMRRLGELRDSLPPDAMAADGKAYVDFLAKQESVGSGSMLWAQSRDHHRIGNLRFSVTVFIGQRVAPRCFTAVYFTPTKRRVRISSCRA